MFINGNVIIELVKIEEKIYNYFKNLDFNSNNDTNCLYINYLKMFLCKEKRIISEIPINNREFNDYVLENLEDIVIENLDNPDNYVFILPRIANFFQDFNLNIKPDSQFVHVFDGKNLYVQDSYEESFYYLNSRKYYKNLMVRYLRQIEDFKDLGIYDDRFLEIQEYNLYIERDIFDEYVNSEFDISCIKVYSDDDIRAEFCYDEEKFYDMKNEIIYSKLFELVIMMLNNSSETMNYLNAELNFKFFISELSYVSLVNFVSGFDSFLKYYFEESGKIIFDYKDIIDKIDKYFEEELLRKNVKKDESLLSEYDYNRLCGFVSLEKEIISSIHKLDFDKIDLNNVKKINSLLDIEEEFVEGLNDISIMDLNYFFTVSLSNILGDDNLFNLINYRFFQLFPVFKYLFKVPGQSNESFEMINRNYVISSIKSFYNFLNTIEGDDIKQSFYDTYKNQFYKNPFLTSLLTQLNGNHLIIEPFDIELSSELSGVSDFEYSYDLNQQLFPEAIVLIKKLVLFGTDIQNNDNTYFHLWLFQFNYICRYLNNENLSCLFNMLLDNYQESFCFDILVDIVYLNLNGTDYDIDIIISSYDTKVNRLKLGGK